MSNTSQLYWRTWRLQTRHYVKNVVLRWGYRRDVYISTGENRGCDRMLVGIMTTYIQCLLPLTLRVRIALSRGEFDTFISDLRHWYNWIIVESGFKHHNGIMHMVSHFCLATGHNRLLITKKKLFDYSCLLYSITYFC